jgi:site-specific recombinase XerD
VAAEGFEPTTKGLFEQSPPTLLSSSCESYNNSVADIKSLLNEIAKLSPEEKELLFSLAQGKASTFNSPAEGLQDWEADMVARGLARGSISMYLNTVKQFLAKYPLPTSRDLRNYLVWRKQNRYDGKPGGISDTKLRNDGKALRSFFNFLESEGLWLANPTKSMRLIKTAKVIRQSPKPEHVHALLNAWKDSRQRVKDQTLLLLITDTGLRISEACSVRQRNIDLDQLQITVFGKGSKERVVPISPVVAKAIRVYLDKENPQGEYLFPAGEKPKHIKEKYGEELQRPYWGIRSVERSFRRICKRLGIPRITPHMLRHYFATHALANGARLEIISKILGHSSVAITADVYRHIDAGEIRAEHKKYSPLADQGD